MLWIKGLAKEDEMLMEHYFIQKLFLFAFHDGLRRVYVKVTSGKVIIHISNNIEIVIRSMRGIREIITPNIAFDVVNSWISLTPITVKAKTHARNIPSKSRLTI